MSKIEYTKRADVVLSIDVETNDGDIIGNTSALTLKEWNLIKPIMETLADVPDYYGEATVQDIYEWAAIELHTTREDIIECIYRYMPHNDFGWCKLVKIEVLL